MSKLQRYHSAVQNAAAYELPLAQQNNVLIVESCPITARGIREVLKQQCGMDGSIVMVDCLTIVPDLMRAYQPRLLVMELCGNGISVLDGLKFISICHERWPNCRLVVCTGLEDPLLLQLLNASQINGLVLKQEPVMALVQSVQSALAGQRGCSYKARQLQASRPPCSKALTLRELDVLSLLFSGKSVSRVAQALRRDVRTVSTHKRNVMRKLGFRTDGELFIHGDWMSSTYPAQSL